MIVDVVWQYCKKRGCLRLIIGRRAIDYEAHEQVSQSNSNNGRNRVGSVENAYGTLVLSFETLSTT